MPDSAAKAETQTHVVARIDAGDAAIDAGSASDEASPAYQTVPYDPAKARESIRGWIALSLIAMLGAVLGASLLIIWVHPDRSKDLHDLLTLIFAPLIALVGSATGYYFGSQASQGR